MGEPARIAATKILVIKDPAQHLNTKDPEDGIKISQGLLDFKKTQNNFTARGISCLHHQQLPERQEPAAESRHGRGYRAGLP